MNTMLVRPGLFLLALLCFLMPFTELSCHQVPYVRLNGVDLAFGTRIDSTKLEPEFRARVRDEIKKSMAEAGAGKEDREKLDMVDIEPLMLASFICIAAAMLLSLFLKRRLSGWIASSLGLAAIIMLFVYQNRQIQATQGDNIFDISIRFLYGFWATVIVTALASVIAFLWAIRKRAAAGADIAASTPPPLEPGDAAPGSSAAAEE